MCGMKTGWGWGGGGGVERERWRKRAEIRCQRLEDMMRSKREKEIIIQAADAEEYISLETFFFIAE